ncbi:hypothetical protein BESB_010800 [Besnoitia besnoiti]|uniref:Uncharacterized protein n=1 Tax=Besnoitia besnoiti TaxID=94643 RepID=A0A2A9MJL6_BESBE|nr:hypothetical protein BESB_010800 [Besnoitia besnoiti]PFH38738.1 hypothetical protein BESB_010800 [Besnoitia besnoiti]
MGFLEALLSLCEGSRASLPSSSPCAASASPSRSRAPSPSYRSRAAPSALAPELVTTRHNASVRCTLTPSPARKVRTRSPLPAPLTAALPASPSAGHLRAAAAMAPDSLDEVSSTCDSGALCCCPMSPQRRSSPPPRIMYLQPNSTSYYYPASPSATATRYASGPPPVSGTFAAAPALSGASLEHTQYYAPPQPKVEILAPPAAAPAQSRHLTVPTLWSRNPRTVGSAEDWSDKAKKKSAALAGVAEREEAAAAALLRKEAEFQARIEEKQMQLRQLEKRAAGLRTLSCSSGMRPVDEIIDSEEVRQLRSNLCEKELEVEQLTAEVDFAKKEKEELSAKVIMKDAVISKLKAGEDVTDLPGAETKEAVKSLRQKDEENRLLTRRLEAMREERRDMRELLLHKDRQLAAALSVSDPAAKEASAVQLGVQAIAMVRDSVDLREKISLLEAELAALKEEKDRRELLLDETFRKLTDKRREAAGLLEMVSQRDMKIARVETFLQQRNRDYEQLQAQSRAALEAERERLEKSAEEIKVLEEQQAGLKNVVAARDEKVLCLQNEVVRRDAIIKQLEQRVKVVSQDLEQNANHLQQLLRASAAKDAYLYELEAQLRQNEVERQASYLAEVSRTRRLALETRMKEEACRAALNEKDEALAHAQHELSRNTQTLQQIRHAFTSIEATDACYRPADSAAGVAPGSPARAAAARSGLGGSDLGGSLASLSPSNDPLTRIPTAVSVPQRPLHESLRVLQADGVSERPALTEARKSAADLASPTHTLYERTTVALDPAGYLAPSAYSPVQYASAKPTPAYASVLRSAVAGLDEEPSDKKAYVSLPATPARTATAVKKTAAASGKKH